MEVRCVVFVVDGPAGGLLVVRVEVRCGVFVVDVPGVLAGAGAGAGAGLLIENRVMSLFRDTRMSFVLTLGLQDLSWNKDARISFARSIRVPQRGMKAGTYSDCWGEPGFAQGCCLRR